MCCRASDFSLAKYAKPRLVKKKTAASIPVIRLKKVAEPWLPKTVAEAPAPKEALHPHPCHAERGSGQQDPMPSADARQLRPFQHLQLPAARQIAPNSSALREAPAYRPHRIRHAEQLGCTCRLYTAAVKESHTFCDLGIFRCQLRADRRVHFLGLRGGRGQPGPDRPDRLVSHKLREQKLQHPTRRSRSQLPCDNLQRLARLALRPGPPTHSTGTRPHD